MDILSLESELSNFGVSLHKRIVEVLIGEIEAAIADGRIRSQNGEGSVFDFIREILKQKSERKVFERFAKNAPEVVTFCHNLKFEGSGQRETPVTDLRGFIHMAYLANCDYSQKLRSASASYFAADRKIEPVAPAPTPTPAPDRKVAELEELLADWQVKYRHIYDRMQYFQARSIGGDMLKRLQEKPEEFSEDSEWLWQIAGVHCKYYFVGRCKEDLIYGVDYVLGNRKGQIKLTPHAALQMMLNLRSRKGVQVRYLPEKADIDVPKIVGKKPGKINRRQLQSQEE